MQVKREELLQFAQGAITGLKVNADLGRWGQNSLAAQSEGLQMQTLFAYKFFAAVVLIIFPFLPIIFHFISILDALLPQLVLISWVASLLVLLLYILKKKKKKNIVNRFFFSFLIYLIYRIDAEAIDLKKKLDEIAASQKHLDEGLGNAAKETTLATIEVSLFFVNRPI